MSLQGVESRVYKARATDTEAAEQAICKGSADIHEIAETLCVVIFENEQRTR